METINLTLVNMQEYHNIEIFLQKVTFQIEPFYKKKNAKGKSNRN